MPWPKFENATAQDIRTTVAGQKPVTVPKPMTLLLKSFLCRGYFRHFARLFLFGADSAFGHGSKLGTSKWNGLRFKICRSQAHEILTPMHLNIFNLIDLYTIPSKAKTDCLPHQYFFAGLAASRWKWGCSDCLISSAIFGQQRKF